MSLRLWLGDPALKHEDKDRYPYPPIIRDLFCAETFGWDREQIGRQPALWLSDLMTAYAEKQRITSILAGQPLREHQAKMSEGDRRQQMDAYAQVYDCPPEALAELLEG